VGRGYYPGIIYQSNNGGLTWTELFFDYPSCELDDITFLNSELGWIAAYGCVYKFDRRTISSVEDELSGANTATLYPNPATSHLFINSTGTEIEQVNIYNTTGSLVVAVSPLSLGEGQGLRNHQLSIINLPTGVYIAEIKTNEAVVKKRWVKM
jgi:hypothetical protein